MSGPRDEIGRLYHDEYWKLRSLENLIRAEGVLIDGKSPFAPLVLLLLNPWLRVEEASLVTNGSGTPVLVDQTPDFVFLPNSHPPLAGLPDDKAYSFFEAKTSAFYMPLAIDVPLHLTVEIEALNPVYELTLLLPFSRITIDEVTWSTATEYRFSGTLYSVTPISSRSLPQHVNDKLAHDEVIGNTRPPQPRIANSFRPTNFLFGAATPVEGISGIEMTSFSASYVQSKIEKPASKDKDVVVRVTNSNLPVRIYDLLHKLPGYMDALVAVDVFNFSPHKTLDYEVSTEILDYSHPAIDNILAHPANMARTATADKRKARAHVDQVPRMKREILSSLTQKEDATVLCRVRDRSTNLIVHQESHTVTLLPKDFIVWAIKDARGALTHRLHDFIAAWITPTDKDGLLDRVRSEAANYHPHRMLAGSTGTLADDGAQIKALFDYLSADSGIKYVNQPFYFGIEDYGQRILTAEAVLQAKCGNCIDLVVLFASLMEGLGINPLVMIVPGHAFLGWGNPARSAEMDFLECTLLGNATFEVARENARNTFNKHFLFMGASDPLPNYITYMSREAAIVDLARVRSIGICSTMG